MFEAARARERAPGGGGAAERISSLIGAAAHDVRSPLGALTGFARALARDWERLGDVKRREILEGMLLDGERVSNLLRLVADAVRLEAGAPLTAARERGDVEEASRWVADLFGGSEDLPEVRVEGSGEALVDAGRLRAMILALCDGAVWWSTEGPIDVRITPGEGEVEVELRRAGEGPSAEESRRMFEEPGSGGRAGLYAVHRLAAALGGSLGCEGGEGVRFRLLLPA